MRQTAQVDQSWAGRTLGGRYILEQPQAQGLIATVYTAQDTQLQRRVAVKVLQPAAAGDPQAAAGFAREAQVAARLHHPHLAQVYDAGTAEGRPYIVMEYVDGRPLDVGRRYDVGPAVDLAVQVTSAVAFIQDNGLLHCDVQPANVLVDNQGQVKLVDFGGAVAPEEPGTAPAVPAATLQLPVIPTSPDSLPYLAPERLRGAPPAPPADVYSLGALLYSLLAGQPPYPGATAAAMISAQQAGPPVPVGQHNPAVPPAVEALVARALAPDPAARFASAGDLERALEELRAGSRQATAAFPGAGPSVSGPIQPYVASQPAVAPLPAHAPAGSAIMPRWAIPVIAGIVLLSLLALLAATLGHGQGPAQASSAGGSPTAGAASPTAAAGPPAPQLLGLSLDAARALAQQGGWKLVAAPGVYTDSVAPGLVLAQEPAAGISLAPGSPLTVTTSLGPAAAVPTVAPTPPAGGVVAPPPPPAGGGEPGKGHGKGKGGH
ncbi:MAG TPA: serine/threonine protein kinase [Chloroflexia bacterium]|nr:serine/threonine protein kinase [Chloroflexia bacterium]